MVNLLFFSVEGVRCAIPIDVVRSVSRMIQITSGREGSGNETGTINFNGTVIPVYSMRMFFGFPERPPSLSDVLIIACDGKESVALWVDEIINVKNGPEISTMGNEVVPGLHITIDGQVVIHDLNSFLGYRDYGVLHETISRVLPAREAEMNDKGILLPKSEIYPEKVREILAIRAGQMAGSNVEAEEGVPIEILTFRLMYQEYAIEMEYIREVMIHDEITPVPGTPEYIAGICAVRGEIISLVDLRILFTLPEKGLTDLNRVIVLTDGTITFGILADYITDIGSITPEQVFPPGMTSSPVMHEYVKGMLGDSIIMLDANKILSDPAMVVDDA